MELNMTEENAQLEVIETPDPPVKVFSNPYEATDNFYIQKMYLTNIRDFRIKFISDMCVCKKVLHIGCADSMVFDIKTNLHIILNNLKNVTTEEENAVKNRVAISIIERNKQRAAANAARTENAGNETLANAEKEAALAVIDLNLFKNKRGTKVDGLDIDVETTNKLKEVCPGRYYTSYKDVNEEYDIIIVPEVMEHVPDVYSFLKDVFSIKSKEYLFTVPSMAIAEIFCSDEFSLEMVHKDHKYWFSPYTLYNTLKPFSDGFDIKMYFLENKTQIAIRLSLKTE